MIKGTAMTYDVINGIRDVLGDLNEKTTQYLHVEQQKREDQERLEKEQRKA